MIMLYYIYSKERGLNTMKLGKLIERFPHLKNLDIDEDGQVFLPDNAFEAIVYENVSRHDVCRKIVSIVRHYAERLGGSLTFTHDLNSYREKVFAVMDTPEMQGLYASCGCAIRGKHETYNPYVGEAIAAARAFESFYSQVASILDREEEEEEEGSCEGEDFLDQLDAAFSKVANLTTKIF